MNIQQETIAADAIINNSNNNHNDNSANSSVQNLNKIPREVDKEKIQKAVDKIITSTEKHMTIATPDISELSQTSFVEISSAADTSKLSGSSTASAGPKGSTKVVGVRVDDASMAGSALGQKQQQRISQSLSGLNTIREESPNSAPMKPNKLLKKHQNHRQSKLKDVDSPSANRKIHSTGNDLPAGDNKDLNNLPMGDNERDLNGRVKVPLKSPLLDKLKDQESSSMSMENRKSRSMHELYIPVESVVPISFLEHYEKVHLKPKMKQETPVRTTQEQKDHAATSIQRFWRYHRLRIHFNKILDSVQDKQQEMKHHENNPEALRKRRRSTILWMIAKEFSKSTEHLRKIPEIITTGSPILPTVDPPNPTSSGAPISHSPLNTRNNNNNNNAAMKIMNDSRDLLVTSSESVHEAVSDDDAQQAPSPEPQRPSPTTSTFSSYQIDPEQLRKRTLVKYINEFNMDANKGMKSLLLNNCVQSTPETIAKFLLTEQKLSKTKIGEYLGAGDDLQNKVLRSFITQLDFTNLDFDIALRELLKTFRLPGEAQKIDRVMMEFAQRYCLNNPTVFSTSDTAYVLAYSLIMLNTDAHNPNVKKKMSLQDFLRNNRGIDNKQNLPEEFMKKLYSSIVTNEIKMDEYDNVFKVSEIQNQIAGKFENIVESHRRFVGEFAFHQIPEYTKPNAHPHDRIIFLFNDLMLITKPKTPVSISTMHSFNAATLQESLPSAASAQSSGSASTTAPTTTMASGVTNSGGTSGSVGAGITGGTLTTATMISKAEPGKYLFRYLFNMIQLSIQDRPDNQFHENVIELVNPTGRLVTMGFYTAEEKQVFVRALRELIEEVSDMEEEKMNKLRRLTPGKVTACKMLIEEVYSFDDDGALNRFAKYNSLRYARNVLTSASRVARGKRKIGGPQKEVYPEVKQIEKLLSEFAVHIMLGKPSASPEDTAANIAMVNAASVTADVVMGEDGGNAPIVSINSPMVERKVSTEAESALHAEHQESNQQQDQNKLGVSAQEKRKRRNTYTAGFMK